MSDLLKSLSTEDIKKLLSSPEAIKLRKTDPTIKALEEQMRKDIQKEEEEKDLADLQRIANLFDPPMEIPEGLKKIKITPKGISVDIHANFTWKGSRSAVLKVSVTKGKMTNEQFAQDQDDVCKEIFEGVKSL